MTKRYGEQLDWVKTHGVDHWLDTTYGCVVGDAIVRACNPRFHTPLPPVPVQEAPLTEDGRELLMNIWQKQRL